MRTHSPMLRRRIGGMRDNDTVPLSSSSLACRLKPDDALHDCCDCTSDVSSQVVTFPTQCRHCLSAAFHLFFGRKSRVFDCRTTAKTRPDDDLFIFGLHSKPHRIIRLGCSMAESLMTQTYYRMTNREYGRFFFIIQI